MFCIFAKANEDFYQRCTAQPTGLGDSSLSKQNHLVWLVVEPTHLKNMRKSNWIIFPGKGENSKNIWNQHLVDDWKIHDLYSHSVKLTASLPLKIGLLPQKETN